MHMSDSTQLASRAGDRYLLLADISGYTAFMASVESAHGVDFSAGIPAGFAILGKLLDGVFEGVQPDFEVIKLEGDAVFAVAPAASLDGRGGDVLDRLQALYETFRTRREVARAGPGSRLHRLPGRLQPRAQDGAPPRPGHPTSSWLAD